MLEGSHCQASYSICLCNIASKEIGLCRLCHDFGILILQLYVKLRKDSITFSPHVLASLAVMLFVLVTNIDNTTEELQKSKIFETFNGENNKTMLIFRIS